MHVPELRHPASGLLDANLVAARLRFSLPEIAQAVGSRCEALALCPDALEAQAGLAALVRVIVAVDGIVESHAYRTWLELPNPMLGGESPRYRMLHGGAESLARRLEAIAAGILD